MRWIARLTCHSAALTFPAPAPGHLFVVVAVPEPQGISDPQMQPTQLAFVEEQSHLACSTPEHELKDA